MPFKSKRQMRAAFGGHIPGISKEKAKEWADETPDPKGLPERAPKEKGKPTLRTKKTALSTIEYALLAGGLLAAGGAAHHHLKNRSKAQHAHSNDKGVPKTAMLRAKTINKLLYLADKFDDVDPNVAKNILDVHSQETQAAERNKHSQALELLGAKLALAVPGPGQVRAASRSVGKFTGMAPKSSPALRAPGPKNPGIVRPTAGIDTAMERFRV